ncbi:MAG: acyl-CoA dehydrogenase family protein, partial [Lapillicoccus sp.]
MSPTKDGTPTDDWTGDFYDFEAILSDADRELLARVDATLAEHVAPIINDYWTRAAFPFEVIPHLASLGIAGQPYSGHLCAGRSTLMDGITQMHIARVDPSIATFMGVHTGLAMGSIDICG